MIFQQIELNWTPRSAQGCPNSCKLFGQPFMLNHNYILVRIRIILNISELIILSNLAFLRDLHGGYWD